MQYQGIDDQRVVNIGLQPIASDLGSAARRHQRRPLPAELRLQAARRPALHRHRQDGQRHRAAEVPRRPVLPEDRRGDGARSSATIPEALANTVRIAERCHVDLSVKDEPPARTSTCRPASRSTTTSSTSSARASQQRLPRLQELAARGVLKHTDRRVRAAARRTKST